MYMRACALRTKFAKSGEGGSSVQVVKCSSVQMLIKLEIGCELGVLGYSRFFVTEEPRNGQPTDRRRTTGDRRQRTTDDSTAAL